MVVIPAGTRNHFALDLGLDRDDVVGALDAYGDAVEQRHRPRRRERARVREQRLARPVRRDRPVARVPRRQARRPPWRRCRSCWAPDSQPFDLRFTGPDGVGARRRPRAPGVQRPLRDDRRPASARGPAWTRAGSASSPCCVPDGLAATRFIADFAAGRPDRFEGYLVVGARRRSTVESGAPVAVGLDGEALEMEPPLRVHVASGRAAHPPARPGHRLLAGGPVVPLKTLSADVLRMALGRPVKGAR